MSSDPSPANFELDRSGDAPVVVVTGDLDLVTVDDFTASLAALVDVEPVTRVDLAGVTFADSTSLGALVAMHERAVGAGNLLCVSAVSDVVDALFHIAGLSDELRC